MPARQDRVAAAIRREVATLMLREMRDPRLAQATVTNATVSRDLTQARVYVSVLGDPAELEAAIDALTAATGFIRSKVGPILQLRTVPEFVFIGDDSAARAQRLDRIFQEHEAEFGAIPIETQAAADVDDDDDDYEDLEDDEADDDVDDTDVDEDDEDD